MEQRMWEIGCAYKIYIYVCMQYLIGGNKTIEVGSGCGSHFPRRELKV